jgi:hypothetical protein
MTSLWPASNLTIDIAIAGHVGLPPLTATE